MKEFYVGLFVFIAVIFGYQFIGQYILFRKSIYKEIYSNIFEYRMRYKSIEKMSESYWYKQQFGPHKISYVVLEGQRKESSQAYLYLILTSGLYIMNIKTVREKKQGNGWGQKAVDEVKRQEKDVHKWLGESCQIHLMVLYPDQEEAVYKDVSEPVKILHRKEMTDCIRKMHTASTADCLNKEQILQIYENMKGQYH